MYSVTHLRAVTASSLNHFVCLAQEVEVENEFLLSAMEEPANYKEAATGDAWEKAMKTEIESIVKNNTWNLMEPRGIVKRTKCSGLKEGL